MAANVHIIVMLGLLSGLDRLSVPGCLLLRGRGLLNLLDLRCLLHRLDLGHLGLGRRERRLSRGVR
jgi:hypothetical protein